MKDGRYAVGGLLREFPEFHDGGQVKLNAKALIGSKRRG
jgi:hypothetical protein